MKKIFYFLMVVGLAAPLAVRAQDAATEERLNKLAGQIEDLQAASVQTQKRLADLAKEIDELRGGQGRVNTNYASVGEVNRLADKLGEIDKMRMADNEKIVKAIEKLGAVPSKKNPAPVIGDTTKPAGTEKGYEYVIQNNDTLGAIAKACRDQGKKVTTDQILKANPGLDEKKLKVGQKIFIPAPAP